MAKKVRDEGTCGYDYTRINERKNINSKSLICDKNVRMLEV
jgi:hypothetical protein